MKPIILRDYRGDDLDSIVALDEACFETRFRFTRLAMRRFAEKRNAKVVVAASGDVLAAFCITHREKEGENTFAYVVTLDVHPTYRRQGLARRLLENVAVRASAELCSELRLHVFVENLEAIAFYEREGFVQEGSVADFYGPKLDAYLYRKTFTTETIRS